MVVREQYAHGSRRRRRGLGRRRGNAAARHGGAAEINGGGAERDRRAGQDDPRRVRMLVEPHRQQAVRKVQDGGRRRAGVRRRNPRPRRVGLDEQVRAFQACKAVVRRVVHRPRGHGHGELAAGEQRDLCALGLDGAEAHVEIVRVRRAAGRGHLGPVDRERVRAVRPRYLDPGDVAGRRQAHRLGERKGQAAVV